VRKLTNYDIIISGKHVEQSVDHECKNNDWEFDKKYQNWEFDPIDLF